MTRWLGVSTLVALVLATASAGAPAPTSTEVVVSRGQPVQIAFANDLSGFASEFGRSFANAIEMAVNEHPSIRGFPIRIDVVDSPCGDSAANVAAANAIVADPQNVAVLGQLCSMGFEAALPVYEAAGIVTITGSATHPNLPSFGPTVFNRTSVHDDAEFDPWYDAVSALPSNVAWREAYMLRFGSPPMPLADLYYDATGLLIRTLQKVSTIDGGRNLVIDRAALAQAVRSTTKYQGVTCRVAFAPTTGDRVNDPASLESCAG